MVCISTLSVIHFLTFAVASKTGAQFPGGRTNYSPSSPLTRDLKRESPTIPPAPPTLLSALRSLYVHISKNPADKGTVSPKVFVDKLKQMNEHFRSTQHQDAHEFLNYLLNTIVEEIEADRKNGAGEDRASTFL